MQQWTADVDLANPPLLIACCFCGQLWIQTQMSVSSAVSHLIKSHPRGRAILSLSGCDSVWPLRLGQQPTLCPLWWEITTHIPLWWQLREVGLNGYDITWGEKKRWQGVGKWLSDLTQRAPVSKRKGGTHTLICHLSTECLRKGGRERERGLQANARRAAIVFVQLIFAPLAGLCLKNRCASHNNLTLEMEVK